MQIQIVLVFKQSLIWNCLTSLIIKFQTKLKTHQLNYDLSASQCKLPNVHCHNGVVDTFGPSLQLLIL